MFWDAFYVFCGFLHAFPSNDSTQFLMILVDYILLVSGLVFAMFVPQRIWLTISLFHYQYKGTLSKSSMKLGATLFISFLWWGDWKNVPRTAFCRLFHIYNSLLVTFTSTCSLCLGLHVFNRRVYLSPLWAVVLWRKLFVSGAVKTTALQLSSLSGTSNSKGTNFVLEEVFHYRITLRFC